MMKNTVALLGLAVGLLAGSASAGMVSPVATVYTDADGFDTTPEGTASSTTYVPGDYCIIDLVTGATTIRRNVTDPAIFNVDEYKTTKMVFRYVPEGKFKAKTSYFTTETYNDTRVYDMELSAYWIGVFELTEAQYNMLPVPTNKAKPGTGSMKPLYFTRWPMNTNIVGIVKNGSRDLSKTYLGALNAKIATSAFVNKIDICTQCQWERAARAGTRSDYFFADEPFTSTAVSDELNTYGWYMQSDYNAYGGSGTRECQKVGLLRPNPWGLWDIYGNAPEICIDFAKELPTSYHKDWVEETSDNYRVVRGGYFGSEKPKSLSSVIRSRTQYEHGCRLVINADGQPSKIVATSLWITDHADAGDGKVHLAFQPIFDQPIDMAIWIPYARTNDLVRYVAADTEAGLANAPLKDDFTFRGGTGTQDVQKGWCWITVPSAETNMLYKIVICDGEQLDGVQLWDGGPIFASYNIGATKPEDAGYRFWWGDTVGYTQAVNKTGWVSVQDGTTIIEFNSSDATAKQTSKIGSQSLYTNGFIDENSDNGKLNPAHDAATAHLGAPWRMMTKAELEDLVQNCTSAWTNNWNGTGVNGRVVKGKGDYASHEVFFPAAGYAKNEKLERPNEIGCYWTSAHSELETTGNNNHRNAWILYVTANVFTATEGDEYDNHEAGRRSRGFFVRPVRDAVE